MLRLLNMKAYNKYIGFLLIVLNLTSCGLEVFAQVDEDDSNEKGDSLAKSRELYIKELIRISDAIENDDKVELSTLFEFPTSNFLFVPRTPEIKKILKNNNNKLTKEAYMQHFMSISRSNYMSLRKVFSNLILSDLMIHEKIFKKIEIKEDECYYFYQINFQADYVVLSYSSNSNEKYIAEDCECSERSVFFYFKLVGKSLRYSHSEIAG